MALRAITTTLTMLKGSAILVEPVRNHEINIEVFLNSRGSNQLMS